MRPTLRQRHTEPGTTLTQTQPTSPKHRRATAAGCVTAGDTCRSWPARSAILQRRRRERYARAARAGGSRARNPPRVSRQRGPRGHRCWRDHRHTSHHNQPRGNQMQPQPLRGMPPQQGRQPNLQHHRATQTVYIAHSMRTPRRNSAHARHRGSMYGRHRGCCMPPSKVKVTLGQGRH